MGSSYQLKNNYNEAKNYFKKSIYLDNKQPEPQNNLGNLYLRLNKYQEAIVCFKNAVTKDHNFFISYYISISIFSHEKKNIPEFCEDKNLI